MKPSIPDDTKAMDRLLHIMSRLRDKESGCPWDIEQNFETIAPHTLEEAYEVVDAIEHKDMKALQEELGDLLLQVVFHSQMAAEEQLFTFDDVAEAICDKLIRRHPHVFGDAQITTSAQQQEAWERQKKDEKTASGVADDNMFSDITKALPAMTRAMKLQKRAASIGFDWPDTTLIFEKLEEEVQELRNVLASGGVFDAKREEVGDILFTCVNLARKLGIDPEDATRVCNRKFERRMSYIQKQLALRHLDLEHTSFQELNDLWDQSKLAEYTMRESEAS